MPRRDQEFFTISAVSRMFSVHPQTLRLYEREGLLKPYRSEGNTRRYRREDLEVLELILNLTRDLGVNLAGVGIILNLRAKLAEQWARIEELERLFESEFWGLVKERYGQGEGLIPAPGAKLARFLRRSRQP
ncbi:MAG: MerR family transcriptional regulator [Nitrospinota bacterium]